jgi:predicted SnoaL-like aldol condensation-catalyzing enzyme
MTWTPRINAAIVRSFLDLAFNGRQPAEAAAAYLDACYRQHGPTRQGTSAFLRLAEGYLQAAPRLRLIIQLVIADGALVVTQSLIQRDANDPGRQVMDTFELADGRIVEHWDVMRELPTNVARAVESGGTGVGVRRARRQPAHRHPGRPDPSAVFQG